jgi:hypothetical protein
VRSQLATARAGHDARTARAAEQLLRAVLAYAPEALLLPADPRQARYAVVRPGPTGLEVFVVDAGILVGQAVVDPADASTGCAHVLDVLEPRTHADDRHVVLRWLGSQRPPARLVHLPDNAHAAHSMLSQALDDVRSALHA